MSDSRSLSPVAALHLRPRSSVAISTIEQKLRAALADELRAALARGAAWRQEYAGIMPRQGVRLREFEHRIFNGLQMVVGMLTLQAMSASPETAVQLRIAAGRVAALGNVHQRLHCLDGEGTVDFKQYLQHLCEGLSGLLFEEQAGHAIDVHCGPLALPAALGGPLGLVVNELTTNSAKYAKSNITVRVETISPDHHSLSVWDDGPGLPVDFDPATSKGLGMKIVLALIKEIDGELSIFPGGNGYGARFTVAFSSTEISGSADAPEPDRAPAAPRDMTA